MLACLQNDPANIERNIRRFVPTDHSVSCFLSFSFRSSSYHKYWKRTIEYILSIKLNARVHSNSLALALTRKEFGNEIYKKRKKKKKRKNTTRRKKEKRNYVSKKWLSVYLRNCMWYVEVDTWTVDKSNYILINDEADRDMDASVNGYGGKSFLKTFSSFHLAISPLIRTCTRRLLIKIFITLATES